MDSNFLDESINYYRDKLRQFGSSAEGMDWKNGDTQYLRFEIIARYIDFSGNLSLLDVGCGNGEFLSFVQKKNLSINYTGIDVVPEMVAMTNERFGKGTAITGELSVLNQDDLFDYVIASGTFNAKLSVSDDAWREYFYENILSMFNHSKRGIIFNCMTSFVDYTYDRLYYPTAKELSEFAVKNLSRKFIIDHSYPLYEQTVAIYK